MKVLSLFDGIAGAKQALKELNIYCYYLSSEIDKYAIKVAREKHSNIYHIGDVKHVKYMSGDLTFATDKGFNYFENVKFDLLIGGSPCQDLSIAKRDRQGLQGERSGLFYEYLRILNETKPKYFILENVASMSQASRDIISQELGVDPVLINSALVTAQQRKRYYWVGRLVDGKYKQVKVEQPEDQKIYLKDIVESGVVDRDKSYCIDANYFKSGNLKSYFEKGRRKLVFDEPVRVAHLNRGGQGDRVYATNAKSVTLSALGGGRGAKTGLYAIAQRGRYVEGGGTEQRFETSFNEKANSLTSVQKDSLLLETDIENYVIRKLTVNECCRLQGFPDGYCDSVSKTQGYKALGNSFTIPVIKHIIKTIYEK
jgi:DNA (cytosine-5)-methyltransferase 3A